MAKENRNLRDHNDNNDHNDHDYHRDPNRHYDDDNHDHYHYDRLNYEALRSMSEHMKNHTRVLGEMNRHLGRIYDTCDKIYHEVRHD